MTMEVSFKFDTNVKNKDQIMRLQKAILDYLGPTIQPDFPEMKIIYGIKVDKIE